jgi:ABC-type glycerol-3-phosphate transport system substrate-binding protein
LLTATAGSALLGPWASAGAASLACPALTARGTVNLIGNSFPAVQHMARAAERCSSTTSKVVFKLTPQARTETEQAFASSGRSPFDAAVVSMGVFSTLYTRRQLQPLDDLVARHGARWNLEERMLVRVDGQVMAIAFMQNTQSLFYRADLLDKHRLAPPATYADLLRTAAVLREREPTLEHPLAQGFAKGFDVAVEFLNLLVSHGGRVFEPGRAEPAFHGAEGVAAVQTMRAMLPFMTPNALASNADDVVNQFQQGKAALGVLWASRATRLDDPSASRVVNRMQVAPAPAATPGGAPAAHLWWDAVVLPRNAPQQRDAAFQVLMASLSEPVLREGNDLAIWVRSSWRPGRFGNPVQAARTAGAPVWPGEPFFGLAIGEIGKALPEALAGRRDPGAVLAGAAAAYRRVAAEKGFMPGTPTALAPPAALGARRA